MKEIHVAPAAYDRQRGGEEYSRRDGLYAAGDISGKPYQYMKAAGEGQMAALNAVSYIDSIRKK